MISVVHTYIFLIFETSEHSLLTADDNRKVFSQLTLVLYNFKLVLYFNWIIISNQIKYYLPIKELIFCWYSMAFTGMLCRFTISYYSLLLKEHVPRTQKEVNSWKVIAFTMISSIMVNVHESFVTVWNRSCKFAFLTGGTKIVNM